jgi:hypothetical protein
MEGLCRCMDVHPVVHSCSKQLDRSLQCMTFCCCSLLAEDYSGLLATVPTVITMVILRSDKGTPLMSLLVQTVPLR